MILLLLSIHSIKALFGLALIMMATPPFRTSSSPTYTTFMPPLQCCWSHPFPSDLTYPYHFNSICHHLLDHFCYLCCLCHSPHIPATDGHLLLVGYYVPIYLWASCQLWPKSIITAPASTPPDCVVSLSLLLVSVTLGFFTGQGRYPCTQPPTWRTRGSVFVWPLSFNLFIIGDPTRSAKLSPT